VTVGLTPVPGLTESTGNGATTFALVIGYDLANEGEIVLGNFPLAVGEKNVHEMNVTELDFER
jgi:hypothetical protein